MVAQIKELCDDNDISVLELQRRLNWKRGTIDRWDKNKPSIDKVMTVAEYFNVSIDYLCGRTEKKEPTGDGEFVDMDVSEKEYKVISVLRQFRDDPAVLDSVITILSRLQQRSSDPVEANADN